MAPQYLLTIGLKFRCACILNFEHNAAFRLRFAVQGKYIGVNTVYTRDQRVNNKQTNKQTITIARTTAMAFASAQLQKKDGDKVAASDIVNDAEVIAVYFSAHWCPPCRGFTPVLKTFWEDNQDKGLVIIFVSSDRTEIDATSYFNNDHGDYYMMKFDDAAVKALKTNCQVSGIPSLCVVDKEGNLKHKDGRGDVTSKPTTAVADWRAL